MTTLLTSTTKRRRPQAALLARSFAERMFGSWQAALQGSETLAPCHAFTGHNFGITKGLDSHYVPTGGSS
jgi:hypothetical protein